MNRQYGLAIGAVALAMHAFVVGGFVESFFFLVALPWACIAIIAYRGNLEIAPAMASVMTVVLVGSSIGIAAMARPGTDLVPLYSLGLIPSIMSWVALSAYLRHLRHLAEIAYIEELEADDDVPHESWDDNDDQMGPTSQPERWTDANAASAHPDRQAHKSQRAMNYVGRAQTERRYRSSPTHMSAA
ncbi:hypothetical protein [Aestuariivirga sp.]|jgi:hypothetical protein|uniref:hypothetical protein n=1 Tax=Aestuariivirga sp. TaxID=2650926 RepID=UPI003782D27B